MLSGKGVAVAVGVGVAVGIGVNVGVAVAVGVVVEVLVGVAVDVGVAVGKGVAIENGLAQAVTTDRINIRTIVTLNVIQPPRTRRCHREYRGLSVQPGAILPADRQEACN